MRALVKALSVCDRHLPAGVADRLHAFGLQRQRQQAHRHLLAGGGDHVELAHALGARLGGRHFLGQAEQPVGFAAHRRRHHHQLMTRAHPFGDALGHVADALGRAHRSAAVLVDDQCHGAALRVMPRATDRWRGACRDPRFGAGDFSCGADGRACSAPAGRQCNVPAPRPCARRMSRKRAHRGRGPARTASWSSAYSSGPSRCHAATPAAWYCFFRLRGALRGCCWNCSPPRARRSVAGLSALGARRPGRRADLERAAPLRQRVHAGPRQVRDRRRAAATAPHRLPRHQLRGGRGTGASCRAAIHRPARVGAAGSSSIRRSSSDSRGAASDSWSSQARSALARRAAVKRAPGGHIEPAAVRHDLRGRSAGHLDQQRLCFVRAARQPRPARPRHRETRAATPATPSRAGGCAQSADRCSMRRRRSAAGAAAHRPRSPRAAGRATVAATRPRRAATARGIAARPAGPAPRSACSSTVSAWSRR